MIMRSLRFVALLAVGVICSPTPPSPLKAAIPRRRALTRSTGEVDLAVLFGQINATLQRYSGKSLKSYDTSSPDILRRQASEALDDEGDDELYYGPGLIGTQSGFTFDFDTGSSDTFVPGPTCGTAEGCTGTVNYENTGTSEGTTTTVTYGSGEVSGNNYFDSVTIAGLTAEKQSIISLTTATGFSDSSSNSLMGLAFQSIAASGEPPFFETLITQGTVPNEEFAFYLGREASGTGNDSELTLGGTDSSKYTGTPTQIAVSTAGYWQIPLDGTVVNGIEDETLSSGQAAIDTGTTLIIAPTLATTSIFLRILGAIPVPLELLDGELEPILYVYPCSTTPTVDIIFGGTDFAINPLDFNLGTLTSDFATIIGNNTLAALLDDLEYCLAAIYGEDLETTESLWVVGDTFLKNWYSIFSYDAADGDPAVSFAKSV